GASGARIHRSNLWYTLAGVLTITAGLGVAIGDGFYSGSFRSDSGLAAGLAIAALVAGGVGVTTMCWAGSTEIRTEAAQVVHVKRAGHRELKSRDDATD